MVWAAAGSVTSTRSPLTLMPPAPSGACSTNTSVPMPGTSTRPPGEAETAWPSTTTPLTAAPSTAAAGASGPAPPVAEKRISDIETRPSRSVRPLATTVPRARPVRPEAAAETLTRTAATLPPPVGRRPPTWADRSPAPAVEALAAPWLPAGRSAA